VTVLRPAYLFDKELSHGNGLGYRSARPNGMGLAILEADVMDLDERQRNLREFLEGTSLISEWNSVRAFICGEIGQHIRDPRDQLSVRLEYRR
jgi:hypothetical protein